MSTGTATKMNFRTFRTMLATMRVIDFQDARMAGAIVDLHEWIDYRKNPMSYYLAATDDVARRLFALLEKEVGI
jgi:hypothetical protein